MIQRINLLERRGRTITHGFLAMAIGIAVAMGLLLTGWHGWRVGRLKTKLAETRAAIQTLETKREELVRQVHGEGGANVSAELENRLRTNPSWHKILKAISQKIPPQVWLASLKSAHPELILNGQAKTAQALTQFLSNLEESAEFTNVKLVTSKEEAPQVFPFTISCAIKSAGRPE